MGRRVGEFLKRERLRQKLRYGDLARLLGAERDKAISKLSQRIQMLERSGQGQALLDSVFNALGLGVEHAAHIAELARQDAEEQQRKAEEYVPKRELAIRWAACIYTTADVPEGLSDEQAIEWARRYLNRNPVRAILTLSRFRRIWFKEDGSIDHEERVRPEEPQPATMRAGNKNFILRKE